MKKIIISLAACVVASVVQAGVAATTNWVAKYVAEYVGNAISNSSSQISSSSSSVSSNGTTVTTFVSDGMEIYLSYESASIGAIVAQECSSTAVSLGVTNGTYWAWKSSADRYENKNVGNISVTTSNLTWRTYKTIEDGGTYFVDGSTNKIFKALLSTITRTKASKVWED